MLGTYSDRDTIVTFLQISGAVALFAAIETYFQAGDLGVVIWRSKWALLEAIFFLNILAGLVARWVVPQNFNFPSVTSSIFVKFFLLTGIVLCAVMPWLIRIHLFGDTLPKIFPVFWIFLWASLLITFGFYFLIGGNLFWILMGVVLAQGFLYQVYGQFLIVTDYPFSLGYSEAGRHYYASTFFAEKMYGIDLPLPFLHPSRYLLLAIPFLIDDLPLWVHRMWQAILWVGLTCATSLMLTRRMRLLGATGIFTLIWFYLFLFQGAVYYHLQICVILVLAGLDFHRPRRLFFFLTLASIWAGISRVNWFPLPSMIAITVYVLETSALNKGVRYWFLPMIWGGYGFVVALTAQFVYMQISGNADLQAFGSSFSSDLLWNRLLPNDTLPLGVLPMILLVTAPVWLGIFQLFHGRITQLSWLRWGVLLLFLSTLFLGGILVSTKIGGGGDLHNLDAYLVVLSLIALQFYFGRVLNENGASPILGNVSPVVIAAVVFIPVYFVMPRIGMAPFDYDRVAARNDLEKLQSLVSSSVSSGGDVLFVTERQLLTFKMLEGIPLEAPYEQTELMEMAMSGNRDYLQTFYADLKSQRYSMIVAENQKYFLRKEGAFIEEDNAWVKYVGVPLLCEYKTLDALSSVNLQVFIPKTTQDECKDPFAE